jgi:hypothetical protein
MVLAIQKHRLNKLTGVFIILFITVYRISTSGDDLIIRKLQE